MNKTEETLNQNQVKMLHKKYKVMDKPNIKTLFQFCDHDPVKTQKILIVANDISNPYCIIKILNQRPQKAEQFLASLENRYDKQYGHQLGKEKRNQSPQTVSDLDFFRHLPVDTCISVYTYLDPYSLSAFSQTNKKMNKIVKHNAIATEYYRKVCEVLFPIGVSHPVPDPCRLLQVRKYVLTHQTEFSPNTKNAVINNLQYFIWRQHPKALQLNKEYYLAFGSYLKIFMECPRIHFNGYYMCKHRYIKQNEKKFMDTTSESYLIQYFRYFRFFSDGSVLLLVSSHKIKQDKLIETLSVKNLSPEFVEEVHEILIGQYRQYKEDVKIKVVKGNSIFNYHFKIQNIKGGISNKLILMKYVLELIDENQIIQTLEQNTGEKEPLFFSYKPCAEMGKENVGRVGACSL